MDPQLRRWLTETAYYATISSVSNSGDPQYGSPVAFLCRTELDRWLHGPAFAPRKGEDSETNNILFTEVAVPLESIIWLPGINTSSILTGFRPRRVETVRADTGEISHYEIYQ